MFPCNYIHNHLVRRGTHSSLGMDILALLHSMLWRGLTHTFLSCSMGSVSVSQSPYFLEPGAGFKNTFIRVTSLPSKYTFSNKPSAIPVSCVFY